MSVHRLSAAQLAEGLRRGEYSSVELTRAFLQRIARFDAQLNAFVTVTEEQALAQAAAADSLLQSKQSGPLTGVPLAHKDIFCSQGVRTTCGSRMLDNFIAPYDAAVVEKCRAAGLVMLGKANMDEFAMGSSNENSYYGPVRNPWDPNAVPGGSSGGPAAIVAAGLSPLATGTDTGGSVRLPAALCGITGLRPTYGRVSRWGLVAFGSSLDQAGPLARSAEDVALLLQAIAGFDARDSTSVERTVPDYAAALAKPLHGLRIGLPEEYFGEGLDAAVGAATEAAVDEYRKLGAEIKTLSLPNTALAIPAYYVIAPAEASSNLARFDGVRYGYRCADPKDVLDLYTRSRSEGFGREVQRRIMIGTYVLSAGYYDAYYLKAQKARRLVSDDFKRAFADVDVIMGPTSPGAAFDIGERSDDPVAMYLTDIYTVGVSLAGLPALSHPVGFIGERPVGLQIIGDYFSEARLLNVAHRYQQVSDWHRRIPPGYED